MTYKISGYPLAHSPEQLARHHRAVPSGVGVKSGDIAILQSRKERKERVGLLLDENKILHVDGRVKMDHLSEDGVLDIETKIFTHELKSVIRIFE
jgi:hypothetical protein